MKRPVRFASIGIAVLVLGLGGLATASGSAPGNYPDDNGSSQSAPAAKPHTNASGVIVQTQFVPLTPCRLVDTRHTTTGALVVGSARKFLVDSTDLSVQGGNTSGCGIPAGATAISAGITATASKGTGYLHAWRVGNSEPAATVLNFTNLGFGGITVNAPIPVLSSPGSYGIVLKAYGANTDAVVDVFGYYIEPIAATINSDGTIASQSAQLVSVNRTAVGNYNLTFNQTVAGCSVQATANGSRNNVGIDIGTTSVTVFTRDVTVTNTPYVDASFTINVTC